MNINREQRFSMEFSVEDRSYSFIIHADKEKDAIKTLRSDLESVIKELEGGDAKESN